MISTFKQRELERCKRILLATLDYLDQHLAGSIVIDGYDSVGEYYKEQKAQTEKYFQQRRLGRLQQRLASLTKMVPGYDFRTYDRYIKTKTGYDIDIYGDLRIRVFAIIAQKEIRNENELGDVHMMLQQVDDISKDEMQALHMLIGEYARARGKRKPERFKIARTTKKDGIEEVTAWSFSGPKPKLYDIQEAIAPDGKRKISVVRYDDGKSASTAVTIHFASANGAIYAVNGICADMDAWWKDNSTIIIKTSKNYMAHLQTSEVRSFTDMISIEYIEH